MDAIRVTWSIHSLGCQAHSTSKWPGVWLLQAACQNHMQETKLWSVKCVGGHWLPKGPTLLEEANVLKRGDYRGVMKSRGRGQTAGGLQTPCSAKVSPQISHQTPRQLASGSAFRSLFNTSHTSISLWSIHVVLEKCHHTPHTEDHTPLLNLPQSQGRNISNQEPIPLILV